MKAVRGLSVWMLLAAAIGGCYQSSGVSQSGLDRADEMDELTAAERVQLCDWGVAIGAVTGQDTDCGDEVIEAPTRDECASGLDDLAVNAGSCRVTVGVVETCWQAMADDPCTGFHAAVCQAPAGCE